MTGIAAGMQRTVCELPLPERQALRHELRHRRQDHPVRPPERRVQVVARVARTGPPSFIWRSSHVGD